jgi:hypothetical protein
MMELRFRLGLIIVNPTELRGSTVQIWMTPQVNHTVL